MEQTRAFAEQRRLRRLRGSATSAGPDYEYKLAGLVALRARRMGFHFELFSNVEAARPCDDLVLRVHHPFKATVFVQLKHGKGEKTVGPQAFVRATGDFSLAKYFAFFETFSAAWVKRETLSDDEKDRDMRLLTDCDMENVHFVLYTTKKFRGKWCGRRGGRCATDGCTRESEDSDGESSLSACERKHCVNTAVNVHEAYEALLGTSVDGIHHFGPMDEDVWTHLEGKEGEEQYQLQFLPRLTLFHSQAPADALDAFILREMNLLFGAPLPRADHLLVQYLAVLKGWAQDDAHDFCLSHASRELEAVLAEAMEAAGRAASGRGLLAFQDAHCAFLRAALSRPGPLLLAVRGVPSGVRAAKLLQVLEVDFPGRWTYMNEETLRDFPPMALAAVCSSRGGVVVVDAKREFRERAREMLRLAWPLGKIVMVRALEEELCAEEEVWERMEEDWRLAHLQQQTQENILDKELIFQGNIIRLRDLQDVWPRMREDVDGALLSSLLRGVAALGSTPSPASVDWGGSGALQIPRTLEHANVLNNDVLEMHRDSEHLALSGFPPSQIMWMERKLWLERRLENQVQRSYSPTSYTGSRWWTVLSLEGEGSPASDKASFLRLCQERPRGSIHWVERSSGGVLVWRATRGSKWSVQPYVLTQSHTCKYPLSVACVHTSHAERDAAAWRARAALLVGEAGIGKSRFLASAVAEARRQAPARWAVHIPLLVHRDLLGVMPRNPQEIVLHHAMELVAAAAGVGAPEAAAGRRFLEDALERSGAVDIFVDSVDELCPSHKMQILRVLELLTKTRATRLWVASRPEVEDSLRRILRCAPASLRPLSTTEQKHFLCEHWASALGAAPSAFAAVASEMVEALGSASYGGAGQRRCLLDVPLHLEMAAVAFTADAGAAMCSGSQMLRGRGLTIFDLYRRFVHLKRQRIKEHHGLSKGNVNNFYDNELADATFNKIHQAYAIHLLVSREVLPGVDPRPFEEALRQYQSFFTKEKVGIMWLTEDGCLQFSHYTLVEYFAAAWLCENFEKAPEIVRTVIRHKKGSVVRLFFDSMLAEGLPLHRAAMAGDCEALAAALTTGSSVNVTDRGGRLALHLAASHGRAKAVQLLLAAGSNSSLKDSIFEWTPLLYAIDAGDLESAELQLISGLGKGVFRDGAFSDVDRELLSSAIQFNFEKVTEWFLETAHVFSRSDIDAMLHTAASEGHSGIVNMLLQKGASPKCIYNGRTALHVAAARGQVSVVEKLLQAGMDVETLDARGNTALHCAASGNHCEMVQLLLNRGADQNATNFLGRTPMHLAIFQEHLEATDMLITTGVDVEQLQRPPCAPLTPLSIAVLTQNVAMAQLLLDRGAKLRGRAIKGKWSPLHIAATNGFPEMTEFLLAAGANPNDFHGGNLAPIHRAVIGGHMDVVRHLVAAGADVNDRCTNEKTPLHYACQRNDLLMVNYLLENGCSPHRMDLNWETPSDVALSCGYQMVATTLEETRNSKRITDFRRILQTLRRFLGPFRWTWLLSVFFYLVVAPKTEGKISVELWPIVHVIGLNIETLALANYFGWKLRKERTWSYCVFQYVMYYADPFFIFFQDRAAVIAVTVSHFLAGEIMTGICSFKERKGNIKGAKKVFLSHYYLMCIGHLTEVVCLGLGHADRLLNDLMGWSISTIVFLIMASLVPYIDILWRRLPWRFFTVTTPTIGMVLSPVMFYLILVVGFVRTMIFCLTPPARISKTNVDNLWIPCSFLFLCSIIPLVYILRNFRSLISVFRNTSTYSRS